MAKIESLHHAKHCEQIFESQKGDGGNIPTHWIEEKLQRIKNSQQIQNEIQAKKWISKQKPKQLAIPNLN